MTDTPKLSHKDRYRLLKRQISELPPLDQEAINKTAEELREVMREHEIPARALYAWSLVAFEIAANGGKTPGRILLLQ